MTEDDLSKAPVQVLNDHEKKLLDWIQGCSQEALNAAVSIASNHTYFSQFKRDLWDPVKTHKFGDHAADDVVNFDMWLKKWEISEKQGAKRSPTPTAPSAETTPPNRDAYKEYWKKYERKPGTPIESTTPGSSEPMELDTPAESPTVPAESPDSSLARRSTSFMTDGEGDVSMERLGEYGEGGKVKRAG
eukprot:Skav208149  [mRNA]  locus=scaffold2891:13286:14554:- [translate_table: standard]